MASLILVVGLWQLVMIRAFEQGLNALNMDMPVIETDQPPLAPMLQLAVDNSAHRSDQAAQHLV